MYLYKYIQVYKLYNKYDKHNRIIYIGFLPHGLYMTDSVMMIIHNKTRRAYSQDHKYMSTVSFF